MDVIRQSLSWIGGAPSGVALVKSGESFRVYTGAAGDFRPHGNPVRDRRAADLSFEDACRWIRGESAPIGVRG